MSKLAKKYCCEKFKELYEIGFIDFSMLPKKGIRPIVELKLIQTNRKTGVYEIIYCPFCGNKLEEE